VKLLLSINVVTGKTTAFRQRNEKKNDEFSEIKISVFQYHDSATGDFQELINI